MATSHVILVVSVPLAHADALRTALAEAGAGRMGRYSHCSFSYRGVGRFLPGDAARPAYGNVGELNAVEEERVEVLCERTRLSDIIAALKEAHPYEEPAFHFFPVDISA